MDMTQIDRPSGRVVVTGGAGFIGSELVRQLVAAGCHVTVVDNLATGRLANLEGLPADALRVVTADIRDLDAVRPLLPGAARLYHLACLGVRHSIHSPVENHEVNATATLHLLGAAVQAGVDRFVHVSSSEVYGTAMRAPIDEETPTYPMTVYGGAKLAGEAYARAWFRTWGYPTVVVRPFNTFGPRSHHEGDSGEVIPKFMLRALAGQPLVIFGDGEQTRDFIHVGDTARGIIQCGEAEAAMGETVNLGSGREVTMNRLAQLVAEVTGRPVTTLYEAQRPGDTLRLLSSNARAEALFGFAPCVGLEEGLRGLLEWYRAGAEPAAALLAQERVRNWEAA
jgi:UDP-glucose 4-epimerase